MIAEPLVTVIMCVYNAGEYLRPALESVLGQTYRNLEILVVDDGSTDGCFESVSETLSDRRIRVIRQENSGKPAAMNTALGQMRGEFYAIQDADDISIPNRIATLMECLLARPEVAGVFSGYDLILNDRRIAPRTAAKSIKQCDEMIARFMMPSHDPTALYRMSLIGDLRYEATLLLGEGHDYILRVGERHPLIVVGENLYSYRVHNNSITKRNIDLRLKCVREVLRRACERRGLSYRQIFGHRLDRPENSWRAQDNNLAAHFIESAVDQCRAGLRLSALRTGLACCRLHPFDPHYHKALAYALCPLTLLNIVRPH